MPPAPLTFTDGERPDERDLDTITRSRVLVFDDELARDTASVGMPADGMWSFTIDEGILWRRTAGVWLQVFTLAVGRSSPINPPGPLPPISSALRKSGVRSLRDSHGWP